MSGMINSNIDDKNIGLAKNLKRLRHTLDIYCLISVNAGAIKQGNVGSTFFGFLQNSCCPQLMVLNICKIFEKESKKQGKVKYELDSIEGVLRAIDRENAAVLDSAKVGDFVQKYGGDSDKNGISAISSVVENFKKKYNEDLSRFKTVRNKLVAHGESEFNPKDVPSYDIMERLFNFGRDFYMLVSKAFIGTNPADLNGDRKVKVSLKIMLQKLGVEEIRTEME